MLVQRAVPSKTEGTTAMFKMYIMLYKEQKHMNTCWLRIHAPRCIHTCMPLRVFMMGMAFRNSGSRQLLLEAVVEMEGQTDTA